MGNNNCIYRFGLTNNFLKISTPYDEDKIYKLFYEDLEILEKDANSVIIDISKINYSKFQKYNLNGYKLIIDLDNKDDVINNILKILTINKAISYHISDIIRYNYKKYINCRSRQLQQILYWLITNSHKMSPEDFIFCRNLIYYILYSCYNSIIIQTN